jgi:nitroreductase/NAD-dependent dihydropyrimidine dehydrogenase PreA subunit
MSQLTFNSSLCIKDHLCVKECPVHIIEVDTNFLPTVKTENLERCIGCGHCQAICPCDVITLNGVLPDKLPKTLKKSFELSTIEGLVKSRRSVRNYKKESLPVDMVDKLLDICRYAPTGGNTQSVKWLFVEKIETLKEIGAAVADWARQADDFKFLAEAWDNGIDIIFRGAPHLAIAYSGDNYGSAPADCVIATTTLELAAFSQGIGACWAGFFMIPSARGYKPLYDLLGLPAGHKIYTGLMLGFPQDSYSRVPSRKKLDIRKI